VSEIHVAGLVGPICVSPEDGTKLGAMIRESLQRQEAVTLDFAGVTTLTSSFLSPAIGCLYAAFPKDFLEANLHWKGLDQRDEALMRLVQQKAFFFYTAQPSQQDALISASLRSAEGEE
jgi:hypothetical protein